MDGSHSTGKKGVVPHFTVMGSERVKVWWLVWWLVWCRVRPTLMVGRLLDVILCLVKGNSPPGCLFHIFCDPQPEIANFWNTAAFSNVAPVQLYSGILH